MNSNPCSTMGGVSCESIPVRDKLVEPRARKAKALDRTLEYNERVMPGIIECLHERVHVP